MLLILKLYCNNEVRVLPCLKFRRLQEQLENRLLEVIDTAEFLVLYELSTNSVIFNVPRLFRFRN